MSTNCLVTKLKGAVDNNNLCRLGFMRIKVDDINKYNSFGIGSSNPAAPYDKIYLEGNKVFTDTGTNEHDIASLDKSVLPSGEFVVQIPKYYASVCYLPLLNVDTFTVNDAFNIEELQYTNTCRSLSIAYNNGVYGNIGKLSNLKIGMGTGSPALNLYRTSVTGTLSDALNMFDETIFGTKNIDINVALTSITGKIKTVFDVWAATAANGTTFTVFFGANNSNIDISDLEPTEGVTNPVRCKATAAGDGTYTYLFS